MLGTTGELIFLYDAGLLDSLNTDDLVPSIFGSQYVVYRLLQCSCIRHLYLCSTWSMGFRTWLNGPLGFDFEDVQSSSQVMIHVNFR